MLLWGSDMTAIDTPTRMVKQSLTYLESKLGFYPFDLLASIFLNLCLSGFRSFFSSFEAFYIRIMLLCDLHNQDISYDLRQ